MTRCALASVWCVVLSLTAWAQAEHPPDVVVERFLRNSGQTTRTTLFDNGMAVVSTRVAGKRVFFRQLKLERPEYLGYVATITEVATAARSLGEDEFRVPGFLGTIHLGRPVGVERTIVYSPMATPDLATSRLIAAVDDLEARISAVSESAERLRTWQPEQGDRVELFTGATAVVDDVIPGGIVVLMEEDSGLISHVAEEKLADVVRAVLDEKP